MARVDLCVFGQDLEVSARFWKQFTGTGDSSQRDRVASVDLQNRLKGRVEVISPIRTAARTI